MPSVTDLEHAASQRCGRVEMVAVRRPGEGRLSADERSACGVVHSNNRARRLRAGAVHQELHGVSHTYGHWCVVLHFAVHVKHRALAAADAPTLYILTYIYTVHSVAVGQMMMMTTHIDVMISLIGSSAQALCCAPWTAKCRTTHQ